VYQGVCLVAPVAVVMVVVVVIQFIKLQLPCAVDVCCAVLCYMPFGCVCAGRAWLETSITITISTTLAHSMQGSSHQQ